MTPAQEYVTRCAAMSLEELRAEHNRLLDLMLDEQDSVIRGRLAAHLIAVDAVGNFAFPDGWIALRRAA